MTFTSNIRNCFFCLLALVTATVMTHGCTGFNNRPIDKRYFDLTLYPAAHSSEGIDNGVPLIVRELDMAPVFDSHQFIYRIDSDEYINDYYNEFVSYPAKLITEKIAEQLYATKAFSRPQAADRDTIRFRLSGKINQFYGDFRKKDDPKAVLEIHLILEENKINHYQVTLSRVFKQASAVDSRSPSHLCDGWSRGLRDIIQELVMDPSLQ